MICQNLRFTQKSCQRDQSDHLKWMMLFIDQRNAGVPLGHHPEMIDVTSQNDGCQSGGRYRRCCQGLNVREFNGNHRISDPKDGRWSSGREILRHGASGHTAKPSLLCPWCHTARGW